MVENAELKNVKFIYEWNVRNFISYLDRKYEISSSKFYSDPETEVEWKLVLYPKHSYPKGAYITACLVKMSNDGLSHSVRYKITVSEKGISEMTTREKVFKACYDFDQDTIISHHDLIQKKLLQNGCLVIRCEMDVLFLDNENNMECVSSNSNNFSNGVSSGPPSVNGCDQDLKVNMKKDYFNIKEHAYVNPKLEQSTFVPKDSLSKLSDDFKELYLNKQFADIIIFCEDREICVHKTVLSARSDYFKMLCSGKGLANDALNLSEIKSTTMEAILYYLYTGQTLVLSYNLALDMISAAKKLILYELLEILVNYLIANITVENVTEILQRSDELQHEGLKYACLKFVNSQHSEVVNSQKWQQMIANNPRIAGEVLLTVASFQNYYGTS
ncbi:TD and POZ domain-containing protein 3 [Caerostris darwini]|uniref:TD and POZ domain-containing protein 3 n=1 Tax=Caerostris darwini TaxID=1538125 RepID=A0AAV4SLY4_9ARAC|nr:TD and POZ domain-containing protein 3 [Caerostris darwini]